MKKLTLFIAIAALLTSCCFSQIPTQYVYVDTACSAILPDYTAAVIVRDNCEVSQIYQEPTPGEVINHTTIVSIIALDAQGNRSQMSFNVMLLDTIPPLMELDPGWVSHTDTEVMNMYKSFYGWIQTKGDEYNEHVAGRIDTLVLPDTTIYHMNDSMKIFTATIPILQYRLDEGYWSNETPDLTAYFK